VTPDLQTEIRSQELTRKRATELAEASTGIAHGLRLRRGADVRRFFRPATPRLVIPSLHDYLTDAADWDAPTWDFEPEGCQRLGQTLGWLYERMPESFEFSALWGPKTIHEREVDRDELLDIVENNVISTVTVYKVRSA